MIKLKAFGKRRPAVAVTGTIMRPNTQNSTISTGQKKPNDNARMISWATDDTYKRENMLGKQEALIHASQCPFLLNYEITKLFTPCNRRQYVHCSQTSVIMRRRLSWSFSREPVILSCARSPVCVRCELGIFVYLLTAEEKAFHVIFLLLELIICFVKYARYCYGICRANERFRFIVGPLISQCSQQQLLSIV